MKCKKGAVAGSGLLFFVFFLMMILIGAGIAGGVWAFYGQGYDFRATESGVLFDKVLDCFVENKNDFFTDDFNIYENCRFNENVLLKNHLILVKRVSDDGEFFVGVRDFETQCFLDARFKNLALPLCIESKVVKNNLEYEILIGSNQDSRKVVV